MAVTTFQPKVWAAGIEVPYRASLVYAQPSIADTTFQEVLSGGGRSVSINHIGAATIRDHDRNVDLTYDDLDLTEVELVMDQEKYFGFRVPDVDKAQAAGDFQGPATEEHAQKLALNADSYIATVIKNGAGKKLGNVPVFDGADFKQPTGDQVTAWDVLRQIATELNKVSAPTTNRWVNVGPTFAGALLADKHFSAANVAGTDRVLRTGEIGVIPTLGFTVQVTAAVPTVAGREVISAGVPNAVVFASQLREIEALRDPNRFGDIVRGLQVFGAQVLHPEGLVTLEADVQKAAAPAGA